jgi:hypothetical protein
VAAALILATFAAEARGQFGGIPSVPGIGGGAPSIPGIGGAAPIAPPIGGAGLGGMGGLGGIGGIPSAATAVPAAAPAAPSTIWSQLGLSSANIHACIAKLCQSQFGMLLNSGMKPIGALSGGLLPSLCPSVPSASDLAALTAAGGPEGVAAQIKAAEAQAKAKIAALGYLATVDCAVWPEAEQALIDSLRSDRVECVRFAAARALATGCCCTEKTAAALTKTVEGSTEDGGILERSERIKAAAYQALAHCVNRYIPKPPKRRPEAPPGPRRPEAPSPGGTAPTPPPVAPAPPMPALPAASALNATIQQGERLGLHDYYRELDRVPPGRLMAEARSVLLAAGLLPSGEKGRSGSEATPAADRSLFRVLVDAVSPSHGPTLTMATPSAQPAPTLSLTLVPAGSNDTPPPPIPTSFPEPPDNETSLALLPPPVPRTLPAALSPEPSPISLPPPIPRTLPGGPDPRKDAPALPPPIPRSLPGAALGRLNAGNRLSLPPLPDLPPLPPTSPRPPPAPSGPVSASRHPAQLPTGQQSLAAIVSASMRP